jgi:hypothetical protein
MSADIQKIPVPELSPIAARDTEIYTALKRIVDQLNALADEVNSVRARLKAGSL